VVSSEEYGGGGKRALILFKILIKRMRLYLHYIIKKGKHVLKYKHTSLEIIFYEFHLSKATNSN
jgi:hypothetical protein